MYLVTVTNKKKGALKTMYFTQLILLVILYWEKSCPVPINNKTLILIRRVIDFKAFNII